MTVEVKAGRATRRYKVQVLRRSYATWLRMVGTDPRDRQSLMRHSRFTTTAEIYEQDLPESQLRAVEKLGSLVN